MTNQKPTPRDLFGNKDHQKVVTEDTTAQEDSRAAAARDQDASRVDRTRADGSRTDDHVSEADRERDAENDAAREERDKEAKEAEEAVIIGTDGKRYKVSEYNNE